MTIPIDLIIDILRKYPSSDKQTILSHLKKGGIKGETTSSLNSVLYSNAKYFWWSSPEGSYKRYWNLTRYISKPPPAVPAVAERVSYSDRLGLYPWQRRALAKWKESGYCGVIEAVTGAGKTRIAMVAAAGHLELGWRIVTIVPTCDLMDQWCAEYKRNLCEKLRIPVAIGRMGNKLHDWSATHKIVVAVAASAAKYNLLKEGHKGLLIADECHHYGAEKWSRALEDGFQHRLGLTATYEREDDGCEKFLTPFFGNLCYQLGYEEALADGVIADFKIAFVGAKFTPEEREQYKGYDEKAYRYKQTLVRHYGLPEEPFGLFMKEVNRLKHSEQGRASKIAGLYLGAFTRRRHIMAEAAAKLRRIWELREAVVHAERTIAFAQTRVAAQRIIDILSDANVSGAVLDATMDMDARRQVFADFESGENELVAAPRLLDEGVDIPSADLGIVLATSRSRRQLIQRMGRVLRLKKDGRMARIVILFVEGTAEDPTAGAQEDFMDYVTEAASDIKVFRADSSTAQVCSYLNEY